MSTSLKINNTKTSRWNAANQSITDNIDTYSLTEVPDEKSEWVQEARKGILFHIDLKDLINDLYNAGDLIYLACNGAKAVEAGIDLSELQTKLSELYGECSTSMNEFAVFSGQASLELTSAFKDLFNGQENSAIDKLKHIAQIARDMSLEATKIADKFNSFKLQVQNQSRTLQLNVISSRKELDDLKRQGNDLQATTNAQKSLEKDLKINIAELTEDLEEAKATAKDEETKAFVLQILGGLFSAVGAGLSAYSMSQNPVAMVSKVASDTTQTIKDATQKVEGAKNKLDPEKQKELEKKVEEQKAATEEKDKAEGEVKDLEKIIEKTEDDIKVAEKDKKEVEKDIAAAEKKIEDVKESDDEDKENKINVAEDFLEKAEDVKAQKELKISQLTRQKGRKEKDLEKSKEKLATAKEKWQIAKAAVDALAAASNKLSETVDKMSVKAEKRGQTARDTMTEILKLKREVQKARREATAQIEELVQKIKGNRDSQEMKKNTIHCLEISVWALMNLYVTFERAAFFWTNIARAAEKLSDPRIIEVLNIIIKDTNDLNARIQIYKSEDFVRMSIPTVINWKALNSVCVEYQIEASEVHQKVLKNIRNNLNLDQAVKALDAMKNQIQSRLSLTRESSLELDKEMEENLKDLEAASV